MIDNILLGRIKQSGELNPIILGGQGSSLECVSAGCQRVAEMTKRRESSIALLAGKPKHLLSYQEENDAILDLGQRYKSGETSWDLRIQSLDSMPMPSGDVDMLFIDSRHNAARARQ